MPATAGWALSRWEWSVSSAWHTESLPVTLGELLTIEVTPATANTGTTAGDFAGVVIWSSAVVFKGTLTHPPRMDYDDFSIPGSSRRLLRGNNHSHKQIHILTARLNRYGFTCIWNLWTFSDKMISIEFGYKYWISAITYRVKHQEKSPRRSCKPTHRILCHISAQPYRHAI